MACNIGYFCKVIMTLFNKVIKRLNVFIPLKNCQQTVLLTFNVVVIKLRLEYVECQADDLKILCLFYFSRGYPGLPCGEGQPSYLFIGKRRQMWVSWISWSKYPTHWA